jgi:hypothetical protein
MRLRKDPNENWEELKLFTLKKVWDTSNLSLAITFELKLRKNIALLIQSKRCLCVTARFVNFNFTCKLI